MLMYGLLASVLANFTEETGTPRSRSITLGSRWPTRDPVSDATTTPQKSKSKEMNQPRSLSYKKKKRGEKNPLNASSRRKNLLIFVRAGSSTNCNPRV